MTNPRYLLKSDSAQFLLFFAFYSPQFCLHILESLKNPLSIYINIYYTYSSTDFFLILIYSLQTVMNSSTYFVFPLDNGSLATFFCSSLFLGLTPSY